MMNRSLAVATGAALLLLPATWARLNAQEPVLEEFYGSGVHQYFSGNYGRAIADLDAAINAGSRDPRAYYFRGLAKLRAGYGGEADLQQGAALEATDTDQYYPVSDSLERIQGSTRQLIERYRAVARANAFAQDQRRNAARYQKLKEREQHVLRGPAPAAVPATAIEPAPAPTKVPPEAVAKPAVPSDAVAKPAVPPPPVPEPPAAEDPFAEKVAAPAPAPGAPAAAAPAAATRRSICRAPSGRDAGGRSARCDRARIDRRSIRRAAGWRRAGGKTRRGSGRRSVCNTPGQPDRRSVWRTSG